jgi:O-succinylbenzoate synthase
MKTTFYPYVLPLTVAPFSRSGLLLRLADQEGRVGWGDIAPLPGWSEETVATLREDSPSMIFAKQSALAHLQNPLPAFSVPLCALLMGNEAELMKRAELAKKQGCTTVKIKTSKLSLEEAKRVVEALRTSFALRVDPNQQWSLEEALDLFGSFPVETWDYIEEPLSNPADLAKFPYPLAFDETLRHGVMPTVPHLKALVAKPTLMGDVAGVMKLAKEKRVDFVLSSAFESGMGIAHIASMAIRHQLPMIPMGLGTYSYLKEDLLETPLEIKNGRLYIPASQDLKPLNHLTPTL